MTLQLNFHPRLWHLKPYLLEVQVQDVAGCGQPSSAPLGASPWLTEWQVPGRAQWERPQRERGCSCSLFYDLALEAIRCHFHTISLAAQVCLSYLGEDYSRWLRRGSYYNG